MMIFISIMILIITNYYNNSCTYDFMRDNNYDYGKNDNNLKCLSALNFFYSMALTLFEVPGRCGL